MRRLFRLTFKSFVSWIVVFWPVMITLLSSGLIKMDANDIGYCITGWVVAFMFLFIGTAVFAGYEE